MSSGTRVGGRSDLCLRIPELISTTWQWPQKVGLVRIKAWMLITSSLSVTHPSQHTHLNTHTWQHSSQRSSIIIKGILYRAHLPHKTVAQGTLQ